MCRDSGEEDPQNSLHREPSTQSCLGGCYLHDCGISCCDFLIATCFGAFWKVVSVQPATHKLVLDSVFHGEITRDKVRLLLDTQHHKLQMWLDKEHMWFSPSAPIQIKVDSLPAGLFWIDWCLLGLIFSFQARSAIQNLDSSRLNRICLCDTTLPQTGLFEEKRERDTFIAI